MLDSMSRAFSETKYGDFWRSGQYEKISSASGVKFCSVEIRMMYEPTEEAIKFLENQSASHSGSHRDGW